MSEGLMPIIPAIQDIGISQLQAILGKMLQGHTPTNKQFRFIGEHL
jgi:hypothetical protein